LGSQEAASQRSRGPATRLHVALGGFVYGAMVSLFLLETAPSRQRPSGMAAMAVELDK